MTNSWRCSMSALVLLVAGSRASSSQITTPTTQLPNTPAGRQFTQWLAAFNSGDKDTFKKYLEINFPGRLNRLDGDLNFRQRTGGFEVKQLEESTALRLICVVKERSSDQFARAVFEVDEAPPHRVADFTLRGIPTPAEFGMAGGPQVANSPAEQQFRAWLTLFNSGDRDALLTFLTNNYPSRLPRIGDDMNFRESTGGFDFRKTVTATETEFAGLVQEHNSDQFARVVVSVEPDPPHRIVNLNLRTVPRPAEFPVARLTEDELVKELRAKLEQAAAQDLFSGAMLIAHHGTPIFAAAYGKADREANIPNGLTTRFRMGSMNKMFTATAILQLVQAGKIKLDDPLGKYLTDYPNKDAATKVTIHQLLTHTAGTGDIFGPEFSSRRLQLRTLGDYVTLYGRRNLRFAPGTKWEYSNFGFILLGVIVERVSGQSYYDYVRDHIFRPAKMTSSGSEPEDEAVPDRAKGYIRDGNGWKLNSETLPYRGTSAGGGYTTVEDLLRFANALTDHKLLNEQSTELLTTGKIDSGGGKYAYGFEDNFLGGVRSFGHSGGAPGMNGDLRIFPQTEYVVIALANMETAAQRATSWVSERLPAK